MNDDEILASLTEIFRDVFDDNSMTVRPSMTAADVPTWDSLNHLNIIAAAQLRFGVKFSVAEIERLANVGDFVRLIAAKRA
jgi:acyl carrier protein